MNNIAEFLKEAREMKGFMIISTYDCFRISSWPEGAGEAERMQDNILEIRIFNDREERKLFRPDLNSAFTKRIITDDGSFGYPYFDEHQYLDINTQVEQNTVTMEVTATGGGKYALPFKKIRDARVKIRYYVDQYPKTGQARIRDWRVVEFEEGR